MVIEADVGIVFDLNHALSESAHEAVRGVVRVNGYAHVVLHPIVGSTCHSLFVEVGPLFIHATHECAHAITARRVRVRSTNDPQAAAVYDHVVVIIALRPLDLQSGDRLFVLSIGTSVQPHEPIAPRGNPVTVIFLERRDGINGSRRHDLTRSIERGKDVERFRGVGQQAITGHDKAAQVGLFAQHLDGAVGVAIEQSAARGAEAEPVAKGTEADDLLVVEIEARQRDALPVGRVHQVIRRGGRQQSAVRSCVD